MSLNLAFIHVSPAPGVHEFPVVQRVSGGWQSGAHRYLDADVLEVRRITAHMPPSATEQAEPTTAMGWWCISGEELIAALRRVASGEDPGLVYAELYANSDVENAEGDR